MAINDIAEAVLPRLGIHMYTCIEPMLGEPDLYVQTKVHHSTDYDAEAFTRFMTGQMQKSEQRQSFKRQATTRRDTKRKILPTMDT